jgi:hypothetical protein
MRVRLVPDGRPPSELAAIAEGAGARDVFAVADGLSMILDDADALAPAVIASLAAAGAGIREAFDERQALEEVYMRLLARDRES